MSPAEKPLSALLARIGASRVGFAASSVREIIRVVAISPLPGAPAIIEGAINFHGRIVPVVDVRQRLALAPAAVALDQFLVILQVSDRVVAVRVDDVEDVATILASNLQAPEALSPVLQRLTGVAAMPDGAIVIYDVSAFLNQAEYDALDLGALVAE